MAERFQRKLFEPEHLMGKRVRETVTDTVGVMTGFARYVDQPDRACVEFVDCNSIPRMEWFPMCRLEPFEAK